MKSILVFTILLTLTSCAGMPPQRHEVRISNLQALLDLEKKQGNTSKPRQQRYLECVVKLSREGIKQSLIGMLCDKTYGRIE
jgi:hypothetical protein